MNRNSLRLMLLMAFTLPLALSGQTYFTQTTTSDFMKGTGLNTIIANDCVSLQQKMASVADWSATTNLPQTLESHQVVTWRNYVYCVGGYNGSYHVSTVYRATQQSNGISGWTTLNALPVSLKDMAVVATQTHLIVIGGHNAGGIKDKIYVAKFNDDGSIGSWTESTHSLPEPRWGMRAAVVHDNIYLIGGATDDTLNIATNTVLRASLNAVGLFDTIVPVGNLPAARNGHAVAVYDSKIIVTGGYDASNTAQNTVYSAAVNLDGTLGSWATKAPLTEAVYDHTTVCANGILTIIGGHNGSLPSNKFYYTDADASTYSWTMSDVMMPERYFRCASFAFGNKIFLCGGEATSGTVNNLVSYMAVTTSDEPVKKSAFIGIPYYIGTPKTLQELNYTLTNPTSKTYEILYRTAGEDKVFSNWTSAGSNLPAVVNQSKSYIQYMFRVTATGENDFSIDDVTLTVAGYKQLRGNLNSWGDLTLADSPYLVTSDISFTSGTHNIEPGVTIMFMPNTGMNIGQASVNFNGTQANPILLTAYESGNGSWNGVYFQDASDNGVTSVMNYTTIEKAGNGDNDANLRLYYTSQPTMSNCTFKQAVGHGGRFQNSSPSVTYCTITENTSTGLVLDNASPTCTLCTMSNNAYGIDLYNNSTPTLNNCALTGNRSDGIWFGSNYTGNATFNGVTCSNNKYGMYCSSPNRSFTFDNSSIAFSNNTDADIRIAGGQISSNQTWNNYPNGYAIIGNVEIYGGTPKLTVQPGTTIKVKQGYGIYVGNGSSQGGMLYAVGTTAQPITFTSLNGEAGGWDGLRFRDGSDYSSNSSLRHCIVEKGVHNLVCNSTNQPSVMWCTFQEAQNHNVDLSSASISIEGSTIKNAPQGLWVSSSSPTLVSVVFENHSEACVYHNNDCTVTYSDCTMKNSLAGVRVWTCNRDIVNDEYSNITFENDTANIGVPGGDIDVNRTWESNSYAILGSIGVGRYYYGTAPNHSRLTLSPGSVLKFAGNTDLHVSWGYMRCGELYAEGTEDAPITFTSINGEVGGWNGIVFNGESDDFGGASSSLKHCIIEKGNERNLYLGGTNQPSMIENCVFRNANGYGLQFSDCGNGVTVKDCQFQDNGNYGLYFNNAYYVHDFENLTFSGNLHDGIATGGGDISENRTWSTYTYYILGSIGVGRYYYGDAPNHCRLTLSPGSVLKFAGNTDLHVSWGYMRCGELYAEGTENAPITFTSMNGEVGGWNGIVFNGESDDFGGASSSLKHCIIEKGNERNLYLGGTNQPSMIENCVFRNANGYGLQFSDCGNGVTVKDCQFQDNGNYGLYFNNPYYIHEFENLAFTGNLQDGIATGGGDVSENRTWSTYTYYILGSIGVGRYYYGDAPNHCRLTLSPGSVLKFAGNTDLHVSWGYMRCGELYAEGTEDAPITFTSMNGEVGGWNGIVFNGESDDFGGAFSLLKHCIVEKGNEYNLYIGGTTLPEIENSIFQNSNGYGVRIGNEYNRTIKNSVFKNNASHGIYIVETTPFTLGGAPEYANSIYDNGGYAVYQDGSSNINMSNNFWGQPGYIQVEDDLIYDKLDDPNKGRISIIPTCVFPVEDFGHVQGTFRYSENKLMTNREMNVISANDSIMATANSNANGVYDFSNYNVSVYNTLDNDFSVDILAGVNATDALLVMRHYVHLDTLTGSFAAAADVNLSGSINGTDAMLIMRRAIDEEFPSGDFYYYNPTTINISGDTCHYDLSFLCYGDVNGSYTPPSRNNSIELLHDGQMLASSYQEMEVPVSIKQAMEMGALTLRFGYPEEYIEIEDVVLAATGESLLFTSNEGQLTTVWYNIEPLALAENDELIIIKLRTKDLSNLEEPIAFSLSAYSELADGSANVLDNVVIAMPELVTLTLGVGENTTADGIALSLYPNPAKDVCTMVYNLSEAGRVTVSVYNLMGVKVLYATEFHQESGRHELRLSTASLAAGMYSCRIAFEGESSWVKTIKLIIEK